MYLIMTAPAWMQLNLQSKATKNPESVFLHLSQIIPLSSPHPHVLHGIYTLLFVLILSENKICSLKCPGWSVLPHCNQTEVVSFFFFKVWEHNKKFLKRVVSSILNALWSRRGHDDGQLTPMFADIFLLSSLFLSFHLVYFYFLFCSVEGYFYYFSFLITLYVCSCM